ncbi:MAG: hypothetical protein AAFZ15_13205 [Bacteroidota bacterium]
MRISTLLLLFLSYSTSHLFSQQLIALHHQGDASFYQTLPEAYDAAANGDTLYLPGGIFNGFTMDKKLSLIGVGYHPDSTAATGATIFTSFTFGSNADSSSLTGIQISGNLVASASTSNINISRCFLNKGIVFSNGTNQNWILSENWIGLYDSFNSIINNYNNSDRIMNSIFSNNVIAGRVYRLTFCELSNNIFGSNTVDADNSDIKNNVFGGNSITQSTSSQFNNNLNSGVNGTSGTNIGANNYLIGASLDTIFTTYSTNNNFFDNDYHVVNPAYIGTDGTPIGIYGGLFPWKDGSLPFTPHVRSKNIATTTDTNGNLHINITVKAQGN